MPHYTRKRFVNHFIVRYHNPFYDDPAHGEKRLADRFYDPSYGTGPIFDAKSDDGKAAWEDASITAFSKVFLLPDATGKLTPTRVLKRNTPGADDVEMIFSVENALGPGPGTGP